VSALRRFANLGGMEFRITTHTAYGAPVDAIESLWPHLQAAGIEDATFAKGRDEIRANWGYSEASQAIREEVMDRERRAVLEAVCEVCDRTPELEPDWYAIGPVD
jgi:hypothetical protein